MLEKSKTWRIGSWLLAALAATTVLAQQDARSFSLSCPWGTCPPKKKEVFDESTKMLIFQLAHNPSLMNVEYLKYFIGPPEDERRQSGPERHYIWYDHARLVKYQLDQRMSAPGLITESTMAINLAGTGLTFKKLDKELQKAAEADAAVQSSAAQAQGFPSGSQPNAQDPGPYLQAPGSADGSPNFTVQSRKFFDYNARANELFSFAPNTFLSFDCPANTFRLNLARIAYRGEPLAPPSENDMQVAALAFSERARMAGVADAESYKKTKPGKKRKPTKNKNAVASAELMPMLIQRVRSQPLDPEAHLMLAEALKREAHLNEAISEYKIALAMSGDMPDVRDQAILGLQQMRVFPDDTPVEPRQLKIMNNGRMRAVGPDQGSKNKKKDKDDSDD